MARFLIKSNCTKQSLTDRSTKQRYSNPCLPACYSLFVHMWPRYDLKPHFHMRVAVQRKAHPLSQGNVGGPCTVCQTGVCANQANTTLSKSGLKLIKAASQRASKIRITCKLIYIWYTHWNRCMQPHSIHTNHIVLYNNQIWWWV